AAVLARKGGWTHLDAPVGGLDQPLLQQAFVDRPQVLDREVTVVDEPPAGEILAAREAVEHGGELGVGQFNPGQEVARLLVEQATVVWGQADRVVATVDGTEQAAQMLPDARGGAAEGV